MRKHLRWAIALSCLFLLGGCSSQQKRGTSSKTKTSQSLGTASAPRTDKQKDAPASQKAPAPVTNARSRAVQAVLSRYNQDKTLGVFYLDLETQASTGVHGGETFYAASVAKLPIIAFAQERIDKKQLSWETAFPYDDRANDLPNAMVRGGTGTLQGENHEGKFYTVADLVKRAVVHSDNQASNQLLSYVALANSEAFSTYLRGLWGDKNAVYSKDMTPFQATMTMVAIQKQKGSVSQWLKETDWPKSKIAALPVPVAHKIGVNGSANNDAAIVQGKNPFALTIMTKGWSDAQISALAKEIYTAAQTPVK